MDTETRNTLVNMLGEMHGLSGALWLARELSLLFLGAESTVAAVAILCDSKERWHAMLCQMHDGRWYPAGVDAEEMMHLCMMACMPAAVVLGLDPRDVHEALQQGLTEHTTRVPFAVEFSPEVEM